MKQERLVLLVAQFVALLTIYTFAKKPLLSLSVAGDEEFVVAAPQTRNAAVVTSRQEDQTNAVVYNKNESSCFHPDPYFRSLFKKNKNNIQLPIVNVGFPKAGTTSMAEFFMCGGLDVNHLHCHDEFERIRLHRDRYSRVCGACIQSVLERGDTNPLQNCGNRDAYLQLDSSFPPHACYWPQIQALDEIHKEFPNATFLLNFRSSIATWHASASNFHAIGHRMGRCIRQEGWYNDSNQQHYKVGSREQLESFFCSHVQRIREFVMQHPSHKLVEVNVEDIKAGPFLSSVFGIDESCWGHSNANAKRRQEEAV